MALTKTARLAMSIHGEMPQFAFFERHGPVLGHGGFSLLAGGGVVLAMALFVFLEGMTWNDRRISGTLT